MIEMGAVAQATVEYPLWLLKDVADRYLETIPTELDKAQLVHIGRAVFPAYNVAVTTDYEPYVYDPTRNATRDLVSFVHNQTGVDPERIHDLLFTLETMAKNGSIPLKYWKPDIEETRAPGVITDTLTSISRGPAGDVIESQFNKMLVWGGLVILGVTAVKAFASRR